MRKKLGIERAREEKMPQLRDTARRNRREMEKVRNRKSSPLEKYDEESHVRAFVKEIIDDADGEERWVQTCTICIN